LPGIGSGGGGGGAQFGEGLFVCIGVDEAVADGDDHFLQLGHAGLIGLEVDGLGEQELVIDGQDGHLAAEDAGALLVPEVEVLGDVLVLIDAGLDLHGSVVELLFG